MTASHAKIIQSINQVVPPSVPQTRLELKVSMQTKSIEDYDLIAPKQIVGITSISRLRKKSNNSLWFCLHRHDAASEVFASRIFRLLTSSAQTKYNQTKNKNEKYDSLSREVPGFIEIGKLSDSYKQMISVTDLRDAKIGQLFAAAAAVGDSDSHAFNYGMNSKGDLVKIDFNNALAVDCYIVDMLTTIQRLLKFKQYGNLVCFGWHEDIYKKIGNDPVYHNDVLYILLFFILLNQNIFQTMALDIWPEDITSKPVMYMENRRAAIYSCIIKMPEFKSFLEEHGNQAIAAIEERIEENNEESRLKIRKFNERIALFNDHKEDFQTLPEYQYLVRKLRYQNLSHAQFIEMFHNRIKAYQRRLIDPQPIKDSYQTLKYHLKITPLQSKTSFIAKANNQKQLINIKKQYHETHPLGILEALEVLLNSSLVDEKVIMASAAKLHSIVTCMPVLYKATHKSTPPRDMLISQLIETSVLAYSKVERAAFKIVLCVTHLTERPYINANNKHQRDVREKFIDLLLLTAKDENSEIPLKMAYRLMDFDNEAVLQRSNGLGIGNIVSVDNKKLDSHQI